MGKLDEKDKKLNNGTNTTITKPNGVDDALVDKYNTEFSSSDKFASLDSKKNSAASNYKDIADAKNIISSSTKKAMNQKFVVPSAVTEADVYLKSQLEKIQSGKTSYSDQVRGMMDKIMNREKFSYDVDTDPLFQQALASAMNSGKQAMQDTIGQASALTGGYSSTYATSAGNQAYNSFIEEAYDNLPQYYQMAMEAYQMEGDEMYRQFGMLSEADDREYGRNVTAYDATYSHRNQVYNEAYTQYRDTKADAFAMANLELSEHGQRANDAYNYYNIASDQANTQYEREYQSWSDSIIQAYQMMQMQNTDWWNQTNFDEGVRQYEKSFAEQQRQYNESLAEQKRQHNEQMSYNWASLNSRNNGDLKSPTSAQISSAKTAYKNNGINGFNDFLESLPDDVNTDELIQHVSSDSDLGMYFNTYTKTKDTFNWFGGVDNNDKVKDQNGNEYKVKDLPKDVQTAITKAAEGDTYSWNPNTKKWEKE